MLGFSWLGAIDLVDFKGVEECGEHLAIELDCELIRCRRGKVQVSVTIEDYLAAVS